MLCKECKHSSHHNGKGTPCTLTCQSYECFVPVKMSIGQKVIDIFVNQLHKQISKGIETYGKTLDDQIEQGHNYDWNQMALEELIDALQYQVAKNKELDEENKRLHSIIDGILGRITLKGK